MRQFLVVAALVWAAAGCSRQVLVVSAVHGLPRYTPAEAQVFSDALSPWIVGVPGEVREPARDPKLIERTQQADSVVRAKIATISEVVDNGYLLAARPVAAPLAGRSLPAPIRLSVEDGSQTRTLVTRYGQRLIGKTVVLFVRKYNHKGSPRIHWYASVDTPSVVEAVERARLERDGAP